jgi:nucleotide-binding universal stress UspA family protein
LLAFCNVSTVRHLSRMKTERILLPIDTRKCPLEIFPFVNGLAAHYDISVTLLNVITLNIFAPEARLYDELAADAHYYLDCIGREYLPAAASRRIRVRFGKPAEELPRQSREERVDLVVLPNDGCSLLGRLTRIWKASSSPTVSPLVENLVRESAWGVVVVPSETHFDCETIWGRRRQSPAGDQALAQVMRLSRPASKTFSRAEGLGEAFAAQKHVRTIADARDASVRKRPMARGHFRFNIC